MSIKPTTSKQCYKCKTIKKLSEFHKDRRSKDGLQSKCKSCVKIYTYMNRENERIRASKYYHENKEEVAKKGKAYRDKNKCKIAKMDKMYQDKNKEKLSEYNKNYREKHIGKALEYGAKYRSENKDKLSKQQKKHYEENREIILQRQAKYNKSEVGKIVKANVSNRRRSQKTNTADGSIPIKLSYPLTRELQDLLHKQNYQCNICGCDITNEKHLDHHIPLSRGGEHTLTNVVWLCPVCNIAKSNKVPNTLLLI